MNTEAANRDDPVAAHSRSFSARKIGLIAASILVSINIWTGAPLLALWIGSRAHGGGGLSMGTVALVVLVLGVIVFTLAAVLTWLNARYEQLVGRPQRARQPAPWLRSMRAEREQEVKRQAGVNPVERAVIVSVVVAVLALEIWFFFFAKYTFPAS
jgi:uncharacterized iron-regulated membrane protein